MFTLLIRAAAMAALAQGALAQAPDDRDRLADLLENTLLAEEQIASWGLLQHGSLAVGYRHDGGVSYWYPAQSGPAMILADYVDAGQFDAYGANVGDLLDARMYASRDAPPLEGPYPLIVAPGGYLNRSLFAETAEFLASHGFVVAYFRLPDAPVDEMLAYAEQMLPTIRHPGADPQRRVLWGFQQGGGMAMVLQDQVKAAAIVSVEGSEAWKNASYGLPVLGPRLSRLNGTAPVLRFQSNRETPRWYFSSPANTTLDFYDSYRGSLEQVEIDGVSHDQLSAFAIWAKLAPGLMQASDGAVEAHRLIAERALEFIKTHTQH